MTTIKFNREVYAYGRNGMMKMTGIEFHEAYENRIHAYIVNSRSVSSTFFQIPEEDIPTVIIALAEMAKLDVDINGLDH